jgi:circadian clock protein KaiC
MEIFYVEQQMMKDKLEPGKASTGNNGLDHILRGGLPRNMIYLVHGGPGTGKTTLGLEFLQEGVRQDERVLYISLLQSRAELGSILASHHWSLDGIDLLEFPENVRTSLTEEQTLFNREEIELPELTRIVQQTIEQYRPQRLLFDSITELALLTHSPSQLHRQVLRLKEQLNGLNCTTLFTITDTGGIDFPSLRTVVHGIIEMGIQRIGYGQPRRWLEAVKMRGMPYLEGSHDFRIRTGGLEIFPRLEMNQSSDRLQWQVVSSGNRQLDDMFGGGLEEGTACLITGTTGAGKSTLASLYVQAAARRGDRSMVYCFDERRETFLRRSEGLGLELIDYMEKDLIQVRQVDVGSITPGELASSLRRNIDEEQVKVIVLDSINGYLHSMPDQRQLMVQLHEMLSCLEEAGVLTLLVVAIHDLGASREAQIDTSYIADTVVLMRNFEASGRVRRCISVLKKRHGDHDKAIREFRIGRGGIEVSKPLHEFRGILTGNPVYYGDPRLLLDEMEPHDSGTFHKT